MNVHIQLLIIKTIMKANIHLVLCNVTKVLELEDIDVAMKSLVKAKNPPTMW